MGQIETGTFLTTRDCSRSDVLQVVSWNINRGLQLPGIIEFLSNASADLVLLQEVDVNARRTRRRNIAREIAYALNMNYAFGREFEELTQGDRDSPSYHGQATLSRYPIESSGILKFRRQSGFWRPRWFIPNFPKLQRRVGARMALVTLIRWLEKPLLVYNLHLESRGSDGLRSAQLAEVLQDVIPYGPETPVVVAGDFNFDLCRQPALSVMSSAPLQNVFNNGNHRSTILRSRPGVARSIDSILVGGSLRYTNPELDDSVSASDHYPLSLTLHGR